MDSRISRIKPDGQDIEFVSFTRTDRTPPYKGVRLSGRPILKEKRGRS
jgi:hypothetical protein